MPRDSHVEFQGVVTETGAGDNFKVLLDANQTEVVAKLSGKMRHNKIRVEVGDRVTVSFSPYDSSRGLITFRGR